MSDHDNGTKNTEQEKLIDQKMEAIGLNPDDADHRAGYKHAEKMVDAGLWSTREAKEARNRLLRQQAEDEIRAEARSRQVELGIVTAEQKRVDLSPAGGPGTGNWRDSVRQGLAWQLPTQERQAPEAQRNQIRLSAPQAGPEGPQLEKKQIAVDWRLALTDPAYRRQAKEQDRSEQKERSGEQRQVQGPQRSPGR
jgi:hypothetical protein